MFHKQTLTEERQRARGLLTGETLPLSGERLQLVLMQVKRETEIVHVFIFYVRQVSVWWGLGKIRRDLIKKKKEKRKKAALLSICVCLCWSRFNLQSKTRLKVNQMTPLVSLQGPAR